VLASTRLSLLALVSQCQHVLQGVQRSDAESSAFESGAGGLAVANQLYNKFKADGQELAHGDIAIVDVSHSHRSQQVRERNPIILRSRVPKLTITSPVGR
jgi:hypothetical protein